MNFKAPPHPKCSMVGSGTRGQQPRRRGSGTARQEPWGSRLLHTRVLQGSQPGVTPAQPPPWAQSRGIFSPSCSSLEEEEEWNKAGDGVGAAPQEIPKPALMGCCPHRLCSGTGMLLGQGDTDKVTPTPNLPLFQPWGPSTAGDIPRVTGNKGWGDRPPANTPRFQNLLLFTFQVKSHANSCLLFFFSFLFFP